jgi:HAD superfamily hydrolase (TIGR01509 family)
LRVIAAIVFDLDGVLIDSEETWAHVRRAYALERGGSYPESATGAMQGMSSIEWSAYMHEDLGVPAEPSVISREVAERVAEEYRRALPLLPGAVEAVRSLAARWLLAVASSANRSLIDLVLETAGIASFFEATVSSEEVERGKPAPDVYLEAAARLDVDPHLCAAVEDSSNGLRSAAAAGMRVVAVPNRAFPPADDALALAALVLDGGVAELSPERIESL